MCKPRLIRMVTRTMVFMGILVLNIQMGTLLRSDWNVPNENNRADLIENSFNASIRLSVSNEFYNYS